MVEKPSTINEPKIIIFFLLKNIAKKLVNKKINNESFIPNIEFSIINGEKIKKHTPTMAISFLKNFCAKK